MEDACPPRIFYGSRARPTPGTMLSGEGIGPNSFWNIVDVRDPPGPLFGV
jgi:hypothetical protein